MKMILFNIYLTITFIIRFLIGNIYGIFLLTVACYFVLPHVSQIKPYGFSELVIWFVSLGGEYKASILSSILTIIGFLIAFQVATKNWTNQMQANLRLEASKDIDASYCKATDLTPKNCASCNWSSSMIEL